MMLRHLTPEQIIDVEIPTGTPVIIELDDRLSPLRQYTL